MRAFDFAHAEPLGPRNAHPTEMSLRRLRQAGSFDAIGDYRDQQDRDEKAERHQGSGVEHEAEAATAVEHRDQRRCV